MNVHDTSHQFAFYSDLLHVILAERHRDIVEIADIELVHRMLTVLRLQRSDRIILFNSSHHVIATIVQADVRKSITIQIHEIIENKKLQPQIQWLLPLLKKEAFEEALYSLTELGAQVIQPMLTQKSIRLFGERETSRCQKIMRAAAEQSKQFVIPELLPIIPLDVWLMRKANLTSMKIFLMLKVFHSNSSLQWSSNKSRTLLSHALAPKVI